jgi:hypothetical protein
VCVCSNYLSLTSPPLCVSDGDDDKSTEMVINENAPAAPMDGVDPNKYACTPGDK